MRTKNIFIFFVVLLLLKGGMAQPELKIIGRITSADGLLTDGIKYTYKDSQGFMWFAFSTGFQRWDGYEAKNYPIYLTDTTLNSDYRFCRPILEDKSGNLFIGTLHNGLIKLDRNTDTYIRYQHDPDNPENSMRGYGVNEMYLDTNGMIWLATMECLTRFDPDSEKFKNYVINPDIRYDPRNITHSVLRDSRGVLWVGTKNGLYQFNDEEESLTEIQTLPEIPPFYNTFSCMKEDIFGNMWFGTDWGVFKYIPETAAWQHIVTNNPDKPESAFDAMVYNIAEYYHGNRHQLWIGTGGGLKVYDINTGILTHFTPANGYHEITNAGTAAYFYIDENDIMWTSLGGLTLIDLKDNPFEIFRLKSYPDSLYDTPATCFQEDEDGHFWIGTYKDGLYHFDENLNFISNYKASTWNLEENEEVYYNQVNQIYEDRKGQLWVGTGPSRLSVFDRENGSFHTVKLNVDDYEPQQILIDPYNVVWIASHKGLLMGSTRGEYGLDVSRVDTPSFPNLACTGMIYDSHDRLWIVTIGDGVFCLTPENRDNLIFKRYLHKHYRHSFTRIFNTSYAIEDDDRDIWFSSQKELFKYDPELDSIVPDEYFNKIFKLDIWSMSRDKNGLFWFGIDVGMLTYNPNDTSQGAFRLVDHRAGMPFTFVERSTFFRDSKGYLYQGGSMTTERGFFRFHPDSIIGPNTNPPPVVLTKFNVENQEFLLDSNITYKKHIVLDYDQNFFSFEFSALDYTGPEKNQYAYMLEDYDDDWVSTSADRRFAYYTGVPPGNYTFRVKASNNDGYWNEDGTSVLLTIHPPPWKTWWAYTLYGLAFLLLIVAWRRYDLKRHRLKKDLELEQVEAEKLKELDSMKSRFFANISHEFRTPLTLILGPLEKLIGKTEDPACVNDLNMMQRNARRLQRLINQLLNLSKLEAGEMKLIAGERNLVGLVRGYVHSFESLANQKHIKLQFASDDERTMVYVDNDKIEKILYNLLSNAFKFTPEGGEISVSILTHPVKPYYKEGTEGGVNIIVSDTGPGIPPDKVKHVFDRFYQVDNASPGDMEGTGIGLALTQELVRLHHGEITVESKEGKGTTFIITLPKGYEHLKPEEIDEKAAAIPMEEITISEIEPTRTAVPPVVEDEGKPILLIVEDNDDLRSYIRSYLDDEYTVFEAVNGALGLQGAIDKVPDLVISDVMMPKMDGYQLCRALKSDERTSHIPVILLTAKAAVEDKLEGLGLGADDFLTKPFDPAELQVRIRNLIEQRQSLRKKYLKELNLDPKPLPEEVVSMDEKFLQKAMAVVKENISDPEFGVESFGDKVAMSRMQLHRKITALTGQTAGEFIRSLRLQKAAELIRNKAGTISEIAYDTGFSTPSYFTECFKKHFGISPTEYQRSVEG